MLFQRLLQMKYTKKYSIDSYNNGDDDFLHDDIRK